MTKEREQYLRMRLSQLVEEQLRKGYLDDDIEQERRDIERELRELRK